MLARVLTLRFDPALEAFDDGPLREFLKAREAIAVREHFFVRKHVPYLAILVTYALAPTPVGTFGWRAGQGLGVGLALAAVRARSPAV